jgi:hypothetical protein
MIARGLREFGRLTTQSSDWPIIVTTFPEDRVSDQDLQGMLAHLEELMREAEARKERLFFITDITRMRQHPPASQRKLTADWMTRTFGLGRMTSAGAAHVTPSALLRGLITAVAWIQPPPQPQFCVATREEAVELGIEKLQAMGALLPPRLTMRLKRASGQK